MRHEAVNDKDQRRHRSLSSLKKQLDLNETILESFFEFMSSRLF
jgi:hypothetical protein